MRTVAVRVFKSLREDRVFNHAAELGFYFLFAVFPILFCASSIFGLVAKSGHQFYDGVLNYLALVVPGPALKTVIHTFNQTAAAASSGKVTLGSVITVWAASAGISAIQSSLNAIYKIKDPRSYIASQLNAVWLTFVLVFVISLGLASLFAGSIVAGLAHGYFQTPMAAAAAATFTRVLAWAVATACLSLSFALLYYWAPAWQKRHWRWLTPGSVAGIAGWLIASLGLRFYLLLFNRFSIVYGSLGAVIILLTWFYLCGFMLLLGAVINREIELAAAEKRLAADSGPGGPDLRGPEDPRQQAA